MRDAPNTPGLQVSIPALCVREQLVLYDLLVAHWEHIPELPGGNEEGRNDSNYNIWGARSEAQGVLLEMP